MNTHLKSLTALTGILLLSTSVYADERKYDKKLEAKIIAKLSEKMGELRPTISYETEPVLVTKKDLRSGDALSKAVTPTKTWSPPKPTNALPPMVSNSLFGLDQTTTASIKKQRFKITWEKFDRYGNRLN